MRPRVVLVLCLACLAAVAVFASIRVVTLTRRVERLEAAVRSGDQARPQAAVAIPVPPQRVAPADGTQHRILNVIDGDTVVIETATGPVKVRVIGIDTPETRHPAKPIEPFGPEASARARELLAGKTVRLQYDPDPSHARWGRYGRLLAYLELPDGRDYGQVIVAEGLSPAYIKYPFSRQEQYVRTEAEARRAARGLWAVPANTEPSSGERVGPAKALTNPQPDSAIFPVRPR